MSQLIFLRVDGGAIDGLGHIKRCINLSKSIEKKFKFYQPIFIVNRNNSVSKKILDNNNCIFFEVGGKVNTKKETDDLIKILAFNHPKILIIDSKRITKNYVSILKKCSKVVIFEDEKKYNSNPDLIINNNIWAKEIYKKPNNKLLGLKFNTISENFFKKKAFNYNSKKILISLGGEDPENISLKLISMIYNSIPKLKIIIILGHSHPDKKSVFNFCEYKKINAKIIDSPEDISRYLSSLRLVISAGGLSAYEFASSGLPQLITVLDGHQKNMAKMIENNNCGQILTYSNSLDKNKIIKKFIRFYSDQNELKKQSRKAMKLIQNVGCDSIVDNLLKIIN